MMATDYYRVSALFRSNMDGFGYFNTIYGLFYKIANRIWLFRVLKCMAISQVDPNSLKSTGQYKYLFLDTEMLYKFAQYPENELTEGFTQQVEYRDDKCCVLLDGERLACYVWSATQPVNVAFNEADDKKEDLCLHFSADYVYRYKSYTHSSYCGQRLMAYGAAHSLDVYWQRGFKGMASYVEANNYSSLNSVYQMGWTSAQFILSGFW